jgi:hypothetical protein
MHGINIDTGPRRSRPDKHVRVRGFDHALQVQTMLRASGGVLSILIASTNSAYMVR